ncbi:MAG TPA: hypothetical protein PKN32_06260 [Bacteroidales bacterium]|nr:hypothetical protein [Bacteroidales bacterium]
MHKISEISIEYYKVDTGWIFFKIYADKQSFESRFSEVFDPLPDFKKWLEAISIGVQQTSFEYDPEGTEIKFDFERVCWDREVLTISEAYKDGQIFIKANIDRRQLVKAFYHGLLTFSSTDKFDSEEWEVEYLKERLCKILKIDEETLIGQLADLDKKELGQVFFNADPTYFVSFPEATDKNEEWNMFLQDTIDKDKGTSNDLKRVETPAEWNIPDEYNFWTTDKKREFITECINEATNGYNGMKIDDFRSSIIEKYLDEE